VKTACIYAILIEIQQLLGLFFSFNGMQTHVKLPNINPNKQSALAIAGYAFAERGMLPTCQHEGPASGQAAFPTASTTGGLDRNLVHSSSLKQKIPPYRAGWIKCRTYALKDAKHSADKMMLRGIPWQSNPSQLFNC
jgi:hypothetical protein